MHNTISSSSTHTTHRSHGMFPTECIKYQAGGLTITYIFSWTRQTIPPPERGGTNEQIATWYYILDPKSHGLLRYYVVISNLNYRTRLYTCSLKEKKGKCSGQSRHLKPQEPASIAQGIIPKAPPIPKSIRTISYFTAKFSF